MMSYDRLHVKCTVRLRAYVVTVSHKIYLYFIVHNFANCILIFKILSYEKSQLKFVVTLTLFTNSNQS